MKATTIDINMDQNELADACWMPIKEFVNTTKHPMNKIVFSIFDEVLCVKFSASYAKLKIYNQGQ